MMDFELWLDESGEFTPEDQAKPNWSPSLVGGILIEKKKIPPANELAQIVSQGAINAKDAHGTEFSDWKKHKIVIPALEAIVQRGARLVYFENYERYTKYSHIELYLKLLASGITQLTQAIAADYPEFTLLVKIASKSVPPEDMTKKELQSHVVDKNYSTVLISPEEIESTLKTYLKEEWKKGRFEIEERSSVRIEIQDARTTTCLKLADYADNMRLTRTASAYRGMYKERVAALFENAMIFSVNVRTVENEINMDLANGNFSNAFERLYLGRGMFNHRQMLSKILNRFSKTSYRLAKLQFSNFIDSIITYAKNETDFEEVERVLKKILVEVFSDNGKKKIPCQTDVGEYSIRLQLSDMYLREGDLISAKQELDAIQIIISGMNYRIENLNYLYFYNDKLTLYYINCMEYDKAVETIQKSIDAIEMVQCQILDNDILHSYFDYGKGVKLNSEYLGRALRMKIYAEMFIQRSHPETYEKIKEDIEEALSQYEYLGELEWEDYINLAERPQSVLVNSLCLNHYYFAGNRFVSKKGNNEYTPVSQPMPNSVAFDVLLNASLKNGIKL